MRCRGRELALINNQNVFSGTWSTSLGVRKDALVKASVVSDKKDRDSFSADAWNIFGFGLKDARVKFKTADKDAWDKFNNHAKSCGVLT